ncbi:PTS sugar transporter subunit IIA [Sandaracinus amylolyticus]|uniref:PTS sugar transporter subunit IIA n=1 Tax=Sandaracinus amylolyticus TaxID=927083 RepID=UPI001F331E1C|nr:PTS sugar transporter subunit IIA [Sandaracinus amylolyticus]UJR80642.1 Hypothetical protein I5071_26910 [Sandaracinus amylolyticus]
MGADLIGWRDCGLQRGLGPQGFLGKLKMRAYQTAIEAQVPPDARATVRIQLLVNRPEGPVQRELGYEQIRAEVASFAAGVPACASCPLGGGAPLGCYRYVTYPVDAASERALFDLFAREVATHGSIAQRFHEAVLARLPASGTGWHTRRGGDVRSGSLAELPAPLEHRWGGLFSRKRLDSAQILVALMNPGRDATSLHLHAELHARIAAHASEQRVQGRSIAELAQLAPFYRALAQEAARGWSIVVDS